MADLMTTQRTFIFGLLAGAVFATPLQNAFCEETPKEIVAVQIRKQGYACVNPKDAKRDTADSAANNTVWILTCENAMYRVRLVPQMAAQVEKLDAAPSK